MAPLSRRVGITPCASLETTPSGECVAPRNVRSLTPSLDLAQGRGTMDAAAHDEEELFKLNRSNMQVIRLDAPRTRCVVTFQQRHTDPSRSPGLLWQGLSDGRRFSLSLRTNDLEPQFPNGVVSSVSFVSNTNTARSLAGSVSLALALTLWRSPGSSEKLSPALYVVTGPSLT